MKKFLVASLMVLAATSAMAAVSAVVSGGTAEAVLPVEVRGEILADTDLTLLIKPGKTMGLEGDKLVFDLGKMLKTTGEISLDGEAVAELAQNGATVAFTKAPTFDLVNMANTAAATADITKTSKDATTKLDIKYELKPATNVRNKYVSPVLVSANPSSQTGLDVGKVLDRSIGVRVKVTGQ